MPEMRRRRDFLTAALGSAVGLSLAELAPSAALSAEAAEPIVAAPLSGDLTVFAGAGCNVVAARDRDGVLLVDGGLEARSKELLEAAHRAVPGRIHTLVNTHWHPEQTGSNERLGADGATIISHENTRLWLGYANRDPDDPSRTYGPLPVKARPNHTFYATEKAQIGAEPVEYGYLLQAHTDGDIYAFFRNSNVLVTGGVVSGAGWPIIDYRTGGWLIGMIDGLKTLISLADEHTRVVPANGPVLTRAELQAQATMYSTISERLLKMLRQGLGPDEVIARKPTAEFDAKWGDPTQFVTLAFKSLWGHFAPDA
jgi:glyoxylase-like metal-dependent hydrolase (beta-lactamase superfamily II)